MARWRTTFVHVVTYLQVFFRVSELASQRMIRYSRVLNECMLSCFVFHASLLYILQIRVCENLVQTGKFGENKARRNKYKEIYSSYLKIKERSLQVYQAYKIV